MTWRPASAEMVKRFERAMAPFPVQQRKMFGLPCAFLVGQMVAGLFQDGLFLRLGEEDRKAFLALEGAGTFEPIPGRPMKEYVLVPPQLMDSDEALHAWLEKSLAYILTLPPKEKKTKPRRSS
ncbi:MAG: TfoX/Sxy family protein [Coprothermobacterota bacterium]|nr:TfoX/Sxy family protein [Coprothermobacterota bacterium]